MGLILVHDRTKPQGSELPVCAHGNRERVFVQFVPLDVAAYGSPDGTPKTDRFTDNDGKIGTEGIPQVFGKRHELRVNEANVNPNFSSARVTVADLETAAVDVPLDYHGATGGGSDAHFTAPYGTDEEWRRYICVTLPQKLGLTTITRAALTQMRLLMLTAIPGAPAFWQNDVDGRTDYRPRVFLPTGNQYADQHGTGGRCRDIGNFPGDVPGDPRIHFGDDWSAC